MKVPAIVDVERLPKDKLLAFYTEIGTATLGERTFEITRSLTGTTLGLYEKVDGELVIHTVNLNPVIQAAIEAVIGDVPDEPPMGSVALIYGPTGTAVQRHHLDGRWHDTAGRNYTWDQVCRLDLSGRRPIVVWVPREDPS